MGRSLGLISEEIAFAIPVLKIGVSDWQSKKDKLLSCVDWTDESCFHDHHFTDFWKNTDINSHPYIKEFCHILHNEISQIASSLHRNVNVRELWAQRYIENQSMAPHNHGALGFSAILYAEYDASVHSGTMFYSPFGSFDLGQTEVFEPTVEEGDIIVFPSMLMHSTMPFNSAKQRTIFSFNLTVL